MNTTPTQKTPDVQIKRRHFLAGVGGLTFAIGLSEGLITGAFAQSNDSKASLSAWVTIGYDDTISIMTPTGEMGQGTLTALPLILAEELDADWSRVKPEYAPPNPQIFGNPHPILNGGQATLASIAIPGYFTKMRIAGAQARRILMDAVAQKWNVPLSELSTEPSTVVHASSGRKIRYGEIARFATMPAEAPKISPEDLKPANRFRLIGNKSIGRLDVPSKVNGTAQYGIDVQVPGMVFASVLESPMEGAKPDFVYSADALDIPGVLQVLPLPFGVAVIGTTVEATRAGRNALKIQTTWNTSGAVASIFDSELAKPAYERHAKDPQAKPLDHFKRGDASTSLQSANKIIESSYWTEHCYHAQMEPMNCTAHVAADEKSAELWVGTQTPFLATVVAAGILKTTPDKIRINQQLMGGGFGRRIAADIIAQTVVIANAIKKPVKLILSREDDMAAARPRPMTFHRMQAALDPQGQLVGWHHRIVAENVDALAAPPRFNARGGRDYIGWNGMEIPYYNVPNVMAEGVREIRGMRVQPLRGIGSGHNKFAVECFVDEVAIARNMDPLAMRLDLTQQEPRAQAVLQAVAEMADWKKLRQGRALGLALGEYHGTFSAGIVEVSLNKSSGKIKVHHIWLSVDPGLVIQHDNVLAQLEGAAVYGLSLALIEELNIQKGAVVQSNFNDYPVLRMSDMPEIHTRIVSSSAPPTGMGEIGVLPIAPAISNAIFKLTGQRLNHLPMSPKRVKKVIT